jgi:hypothetical protein
MDVEKGDYKKKALIPERKRGCLEIISEMLLLPLRGYVNANATV